MIVSAEDYKVVTDSRGEDVKVPTEINRVVSISDGLIEGTMIYFGVEDKLVGVGSSCIQRNFKYDFLNSGERGRLSGSMTFPR